MSDRKAKKSTKTARSRSVVKHSFRKVARSHSHFIGILLLFVSISLFAIFSFWSSTDAYISHMYASVSHNDTIKIDGVSNEGEMKEVKDIFTDVSSEHINSEAIESLYNDGIIKGYVDGGFRPDDPINRAEFLVVITNAVDADFGGMSLSDCCTDVSDQWYAAFVCYAKREGWVKGYEDGSCRPESDVTKAEAIKIAYEAFGLSTCPEVDQSPYPDVDLNDWYASYACAANRDSVIAKSGSFNGNTPLTRAEVAQIVFNMLEK